MWTDPCSWARKRLPLLAGGELIGPDRRKAERHLIGCVSCRDRLEGLRSSVSLLQAVASWAGPKADAPSIWPAVAREIREARRDRPSPFAIDWGIRVWGSAALAASVLVVAGLGASWSLSHRHKLAAAKPKTGAHRLVSRPSPPVQRPSDSVLVAESSNHRPDGDAPPPVAPVPSGSRPQVENTR